MNYHCHLATLWRIPLKMQDRHLRQQNLTLFRNTHGALLYLLTLGLHWQLQKYGKTRNKSRSAANVNGSLGFPSPGGFDLGTQSKYRRFRWNHWSNPRRSGWLPDYQAPLLSCLWRVRQGSLRSLGMRLYQFLGTKMWLGTYYVLLLTWFAYQIKNSNTAQDTRRTWFRTSGRDKLPSGYLFQHPQLLIHKPFYDACIHCICFCQAQACFPLHSTCHWPVTSARLRSPYGWPGFQKLS